jgi:hypothetical protein
MGSEILAEFILNLGTYVRNGIGSFSRIYFQFRRIYHKWHQKFQPNLF